MATSGIEHATFWLVMQCLNHLRDRVPSPYVVTVAISFDILWFSSLSTWPHHRSRRDFINFAIFVPCNTYDITQLRETRDCAGTNTPKCFYFVKCKVFWIQNLPYAPTHFCLHSCVETQHDYKHHLEGKLMSLVKIKAEYLTRTINVLGFWAVASSIYCSVYPFLDFLIKFHQLYRSCSIKFEDRAIRKYDYRFQVT
jgi:hypothetical protein